MKNDWIQKKVWNNIWENYTKYTDIDLRESRARYKISLFHKSPLAIKDGTWIIDVGCGICQNLLSVTSSKTVHLVGIDISLKALSIAQNYVKRYRDYIYLINSSILELPFREDIFDLIISFGVLEHINEIRAALNTLFNVMKPGGQLAIVGTNKRSFGCLERRFISKVSQWPYGYQREFDLDEFEHLLKEAGFTILNRGVAGAQKDLTLIYIIDKLLSMFLHNWGFYFYFLVSKS